MEEEDDGGGGGGGGAAAPGQQGGCHSVPPHTSGGVSGAHGRARPAVVARLPELSMVGRIQLPPPPPPRGGFKLRGDVVRGTQKRTRIAAEGLNSVYMAMLRLLPALPTANMYGPFYRSVTDIHTVADRSKIL